MALLILVAKLPGHHHTLPSESSWLGDASESRTQRSSAKTAILDYEFLEQRRD